MTEPHPQRIFWCKKQFPDLECPYLLKGIFNDAKLCGVEYFCLIPECNPNASHSSATSAEKVLDNLNCDTCTYFPTGSIFDRECPQSNPLPFDWDVPIDIWQEITRRIGCTQHSSLKRKPSRTDKLIIELKRFAGQRKEEP
jgi:hypothetical protein